MMISKRMSVINATVMVTLVDWKLIVVQEPEKLSHPSRNC